MHTGIKYFTEVFLYVLPFNWARKKLKKINHPKIVLAHFGPSLAHCAPLGGRAAAGQNWLKTRRSAAEQATFGLCDHSIRQFQHYGMIYTQIEILRGVHDHLSTVAAVKLPFFLMS